MDFPGRANVGRRVADIRRGDVFVAVRGRVGRIIQTGIQAGIESLPVEGRPLVQVVGRGMAGDSRGVIYGFAAVGFQVEPVIVKAEILAVVLAERIVAVQKLMS